jgi:Ion channel
MYKAKLTECLIDPAQFRENFDLETDSNIAIGWFHAMYRNSVATSQPTYARESLYLMRVAERSQILHDIKKCKNRTTNSSKYLMSLAHACVSGYGQKTWRILATFATLSVAAATINYIFREEIFDGGQMSLLDSIYFTCITISTVGFGDVTPKTEIGKLAISFQALLGPLFFTMALTEIAGRIMRRD